MNGQGVEGTVCATPEKEMQDSEREGTGRNRKKKLQKGKQDVARGWEEINGTRKKERKGERGIKSNETEDTK